MRQAESETDATKMNLWHLLTLLMIVGYILGIICLEQRYIDWIIARALEAESALKDYFAQR